MDKKYKLEGGKSHDNKDGTFSVTPLKLVEVNNNERIEQAADKIYDSSFNGIGQETQVYRRSFGLGFKAGVKWAKDDLKTF